MLTRRRAAPTRREHLLHALAPVAGGAASSTNSHAYVPFVSHPSAASSKSRAFSAARLQIRATRSPSGGGEPKQARPALRTTRKERRCPISSTSFSLAASKKQAEARIRANVVWSMTRRSRSRPPRSALSAVIAGSVSKRRHSTATEQTEITDGARSCPGRTSRPHGLKPEGRAVRGAHSPRKSGDDSSARPVRRPESDLALCLAEKRSRIGFCDSPEHIFARDRTDMNRSASLL